MKKYLDIITYILVIIVVILIRVYIVTPVKVSGISMEPTLRNGDILFLYKLDKSYQYGDIVVIKHDGEELIKRIIGTPLDNVKYLEGKLYINNKEVIDKFSKDTDYFEIDSIPKDSYLVMGDNRKNSYDGRNIGFIKKSDILGKTNIRIYPFNKIGKVMKEN